MDSGFDVEIYFLYTKWRKKDPDSVDIYRICLISLRWWMVYLGLRRFWVNLILLFVNQRKGKAIVLLNTFVGFGLLKVEQ